MGMSCVWCCLHSPHVPDLTARVCKTYLEAFSPAHRIRRDGLQQSQSPQQHVLQASKRPRLDDDNNNNSSSSSGNSGTQPPGGGGVGQQRCWGTLFGGLVGLITLGPEITGYV